MAIAPALELAHLVLSPAPGLQFTRHGRGGRVRYVASDVRRGKHLSLRPDAYRLLGAFDGTRTIGTIYGKARPGLFPGSATAAQVILSLYTAGLITGDALPPTRVAVATAPIEAQLVSWRRELIELGPWLPRLDQLFGRLFTSGGALVWSLLLIAGLWTLANRPLEDGTLSGWLAQLDPASAFGLYLVFLVLKAVHELGHAVAYRRFAAAEGVRVDSVRAGLALMFLVPFPFTNVTGAWQLAGRMRRVMVGAAGMYIESWAALIALLIWGWSGDPIVRAAAGQVAAVSGLTTVLFNLNPLGRMDGYYIFIDLIERPNLARTASQAALAVLARLTGALSRVRVGSIEGPILLYWLGALVFRVTIYAALFWTAVKTGALAAVAVLIIAGSLLAFRPLAASLRWLLTVADDPSRTRRRLWAAAIVAVLALLLPLPTSSTLEGIVERQGMSLVFPPRAARLAADGSARFVTVEADLDRAELAAKRMAAMTQWRQAVEEGRSDAHAYGDSAAALARQSTQLDGDLAAMRTPLTGTAIEPLDLDDHRGSMIALGGRPVAVRLPSTTYVIRAVASEASRTALAASSHGRARALGDPATFAVVVRSVARSASDRLPSAALGRFGGGEIAVAAGDRSGRRAAEPMIEVVVSPSAAHPLLRHGQRVEVRLAGPLRPVAYHLYQDLALALGAASRE